MKQKIISVLLVLAVSCMLLTGCGSSETPASPSNGNTNSAGSSSSSTGGSTSKPSHSKPASSSSSSSASSSSSSSSNTTEADKPLVIGYNSTYYIESGDYYYCYYFVELTNPNSTKSVQDAKMNTTIKNADGKVICSDSSYLPTVAPNETIYYTDEFMLDEEPDFAHCTIEYGTYSFVEQSKVKAAKSSEIRVSNTYGKESGSLYNKFTGEVTNTSKYDASRVKVMVIYNGKIYGGDSTTIYNLPAGGVKSFQFLAHKLPVDSYQYQIIAVAY